MFAVTIRFRCYESGLVFDLSKAYHSMLTGLVEKHVRRLVWHFSPDDPWQEFGFDTVAFGDKPAATLLEICKDVTVDAGENIDLVAAKKLKEDSYVDDFVTGGSKSEVVKMMGERLGKGVYSGTVSAILKKGNLKVKVMIPTGETNQEAMDLLGNKVLGYGWNASTDEMAVRFPINISKRIRNLKEKPDLTPDTLHLLSDVKLTKRLCLGITNGFLDFLGISCPFLLRFKLLMKQVFEKQDIKAWNAEVSGDDKLAWTSLIKEAVFSGSLVFPRTTRPVDAIGACTLVSFDDGSFEAFSAAVYVRWEVACKHENMSECHGEFVCQLLCAKAKVTPMSGMTIPRSEISGMTLSSRLTLSSVKAMAKDDSLKPANVILLSDSECSISALAKSSSALKPYFHNRVSEIRENMKMMSEYCKVEEVFHIAGKDNIADIATHSNAKLSDLGPESEWQKGPPFLSCRRNLWPITRDFVKVDLPDNELRTVKSNKFAALRIFCCANKLTETW